MAEQLQQAEAVKEALEGRALALVSVAGTLAAALLAVAAFAGVRASPGLSVAAELGVVGAVAGFVGAVYFALQILRPSPHPLAPVDELQRLIKDGWDHSEDRALRKLAEFQIGSLTRYRERNAEKAEGIHRVVLCETIGLASLAAAVVLALWT